MSIKADESQVDLPYWLGELLCNVLDLLEQNSSLDAITEKILDAKALAVWRRENVAFDLRLEEAIDLVGALSEHLQSDPADDSTRSHLLQIQDRIKACADKLGPNQELT